MRNLPALLCLSLLLGACTSGRIFKSASPRAAAEEIRAKVERSRQALENGDTALSRELNDRATVKLTRRQDFFSSSEYERLHTEIAFLRLKAVHGENKPPPVVESGMFPLIFNSRVEKWKRYYTARGRGHFSRYLSRAAVYMDEVKEILAEEGLPPDLAYVAIVESGYYPFARSSAGAVGIWQFMENTARMKGLDINYWVDERRDPLKASRAAASYLKGLYEEFGSWEMALAAYNYGPTAVRRRIRTFNTDDYWEIYLPRETEEFIPKIMATIFIAKEPGLFGFTEHGSNPRSYKKFALQGAADLRELAAMAGCDISSLQMLNPELRRMATPPGGYEIRLPGENYEKFAENYRAMPSETVYMTQEEINRRIRRVQYYRVRRGDNLWNISRRYNVSVSQIKQWNNLSTARIFPNQRLKLYIRGG